MKKIVASICSCFCLLFSLSASRRDTVYFEIDMSHRNSHRYDIEMRTSVGCHENTLDVSMPQWSPGYYQLMNFADDVISFAATDTYGNLLPSAKITKDTWRVHVEDAKGVCLSYSVSADRRFVGTAYIDSNRAFIKPAALFMHVRNELDGPVLLNLNVPDDWPDVATGLTPLPNRHHTYIAKDFDILYDSPLLVGTLRKLPSFYVRGIEHRFIGWGMDEFDEVGLMADIRKIVISSVDMFDDIPYEHYTFIGIGPGQGGIEQLNSTAISFTGPGADGPARNRTLSFIAHEYFHHYNVKRIRPVELGHFDYSQPNRTNLLWVAEGLTVYYENVVMKRAGLRDGYEILEQWASVISRLESNEGRFKQTLAESSWNTWEDGPFGKPGETISYYVKGPIVGMLLDIEIRHATNNNASLDDVMRRLYDVYYKTAKRGFTEIELRKLCEEVAGRDLESVFRYVYSMDEVDYQSFFKKAGLIIRFDHEVDSHGREVNTAIIELVQELDDTQRMIREAILGL